MGASTLMQKGWGTRGRARGEGPRVRIPWGHWARRVGAWPLALLAPSEVL